MKIFQRCKRIVELQNLIRSATKGHKPRAALYSELRILVVKRAERKERRHA